MSLFGDDDDGPSSTLFRDAPTKKNGGLFGDDTADPWIPTPKKRKDPAQILNQADIPDRYVEIFETYSADGEVSSKQLNQLMIDADMTESDRESIASIVLPGRLGSGGLSRGSINVALVLIALAQRGEDLTIDAVDDLKDHRLPIPKLNTQSMPNNRGNKSPSSTDNKAQVSPVKPQQTTLDSYITTAPLKDTSSVLAPQRENIDDPWSPSASTTHIPRYDEPDDPVAQNSYDSSPTLHSALEFDAVTVRALEGKEGRPLWKHINYEVKSAKRKSSVVRRYSDFAWLLECLLKQYPFRQVPLLPPKRLAGMTLTGKQADMSFLEKRRRGLSRFTNALERHPVFRSDQLVTTFLTVPTELAVWRKQASLNIREEFDDRYLAVDLERSLPQGIDEWMFKTQLALKGATESFASLTALQERLIKRQEATSSDFLRYSLVINAFCEQEAADCGVLGKENGPGIMNGLKAVSKHHTSAQKLLENECRHLEDNLLEDLKRHRDTLNAMNELFTRHGKYAGDNIPALEKRIAASKSKLSALDLKPDAKEAEKEKLRTSVSSDQNTIVKLESRRIFIRECVWHELQYFESQQVHISKLVNDMAAARADYAKKNASLAQSLVGDVEGMP